MTASTIERAQRGERLTTDEYWQLEERLRKALATIPAKDLSDGGFQLRRVRTVPMPRALRLESA